MTAAMRGCPVSAAVPDLTDPVLYSDGDPHRIFARLRQREPVSWSANGEGPGFWSVTKYRDADVVLRDHSLFTSERGTLLNILGTDDPAGGKQMAVTDPPKHTRLREPLQRALSMKAVERHRETIRTTVVRLIEPLAEDGAFDFAEAMVAMPMAVTGTLMGLPSADWPRLADLTTAAIAPDDPEYTLPLGPQATLETAHRELFAYFQDVVHQRRKAPGDDLISFLMSIEPGGRRMTPGEIMSNCYSLLLGANVTTPHVASAAMATQTGTGVLEDWAAHPELTVGGTEEALRWASPANHFMRYAVQDVVLAEREIAAGEAVVVWLGSANRDEEVFADPFVFDIRRKPNRHIAFGIGPHYCVGHTVAKVTLRLLFGELLSRFEGFELVGEPERLRSNFVAGYKHLPIVARVRPVPGPVSY
ncbi:cytochrome P450 [Streptomyces griseus]|uniref:Cytochrome P450 n=1 Tax=Streptomyces sp. CMC78 TaxID=3231512 RepID=A0AB33KQV5_9ACTN|nr:cytochrome P450 [Streptomyces fimicarius]WTC91420.1 cytochrome P450 [Streptomyces griseus]WTD65947.1 cytochrome P450 [Streptomyces griseus]